MNEKIAFIGAGKVSTALGLYFKNKGFEIQGYCSRNPKSTEEAAQLTNSRSYPSVEKLVNDSSMIWITTPDDHIEVVIRQISQLTISEKSNKIVLHASGAHSLAILAPLREVGYRTACAHPLLAFNNPALAQEKLNEVWFAIEETNEEDRYLIDFFNKCGNQTILISSDKKALYHAAACVLSNYLVTLFNASYKIFEKSGVPKKDIQKATTPLLESVIHNLKNKNGKDALTGPIKRNDENTIRMHLESLSAFLPEMTELYKMLGKETMNMTGDHSLKKLFE